MDGPEPEPKPDFPATAVCLHQSHSLSTCLLCARCSTGYFTSSKPPFQQVFFSPLYRRDNGAQKVSTLTAAEVNVMCLLGQAMVPSFWSNMSPDVAVEVFLGVINMQTTTL